MAKQMTFTLARTFKNDDALAIKSFLENLLVIVVEMRELPQKEGTLFLRTLSDTICGVLYSTSIYFGKRAGLKGGC